MMYTFHSLGICLVINNVLNLVAGEKQLKDLFKFLSFDVLIGRGPNRDKMYSLADELAKKDHSLFDTFVVIFITSSGQCSGISCAGGRNASLEHVMMEFTASRCLSLRVNPSYFLLRVFKGHLQVSTISAQGEAL